MSSTVDSLPITLVIILIIAYPNIFIRPRLRNLPYATYNLSTSNNNSSLSVSTSDCGISRYTQRTMYEQHDQCECTVAFTTGNKDGDKSEENEKEEKQESPSSRIPTYDEFARFRNSSRPPDSHYPMGPGPNARRSGCDFPRISVALVVWTSFIFLAFFFYSYIKMMYISMNMSNKVEPTVDY